MLLVAVCLIGCGGGYSYEKPFVIISKSFGSCWSGACDYTYQDANGVKRSFCDDRTIYMIGDTIK